MKDSVYNVNVPYVPPRLTVVRFATERGFASSEDETVYTIKLWEQQDGTEMLFNNQDHIEVYQTGNGWVEGSNHFWD